MLQIPRIVQNKPQVHRKRTELEPDLGISIIASMHTHTVDASNAHKHDDQFITANVTIKYLSIRCNL